MNAFLLTFALIALVIIFIALLHEDTARPPPHPLSGRERSLGERVDVLLAEHRAEPDRLESRLLSLGPQVIPHLLRQLERVDLHPLALTPTQQRTVEQVLSDFGPQVIHHIQRFIRRVHRVSPTFPALLRVLCGLGEDVLLDLAQRRADLPFALLAPLAIRFPRSAERLLHEHEAWSHPELELLELALSSATRSPRRPAARPLRRDVAQTPEEVSLREILARPGPPCTRREISQLARHLQDPRAQERLILCVHAGHALALRELARVDHSDIASFFVRLLRAPLLDDADLEDLRQAVLLRPVTCLPVLSRGLRSNAPRVVLRSIELISVLPNHDSLSPMLKALGRHRYSPLEHHLCAPLLLKWDDIVAEVFQALESSDREILLSAIELLGYLGDAEAIGPLLDCWKRKPRLSDAILNAIEMIGDEARAPLRAWLDDHPEAPGHYLVRRRIDVLSSRPCPP